MPQGFRANLAVFIVACMAYAANAAPAEDKMRFEVETTDAKCGACTVVYATGNIERTTPADFEEFSRSNALPVGSTIVFNSPGGSLFAGIEIGEKIRAHRLHTSVYGRHPAGDHEGGVCASACAYAFLGGMRRTVGPTAKFGLHQFYGQIPASVAVSQTQAIVSVIANYIRTMGGSQEIIEIASSVPGGDIRWLSALEMRRLSIITAKGTRYAPEWTVKPGRVLGGFLLVAETLQSDGAVASLSLGCNYWDPLIEKHPRTYSLLVTLPDPPGGAAALEQFQLTRLRIKSVQLISPSSSATLAAESWRDPLVGFGGGIVLGVDFFSSPLQILDKQEAILAWSPSILGRDQVLLPSVGFAAAFQQLRTACEAA